MKIIQQLSALILLILCVSALYGSFHMIRDPTGYSLGLPYYLVVDSVFSNYAMIGWLLFYTVGLFSCIILVLYLFKSNSYPFFTMLQGVILCIFILVQMLLFSKTFFIQYIFLVVGISLVALGAWQNQDMIIDDSKK